MAICARCQKPALAGERVETHTPVYYKKNGWIGDQFIPYERQVRTTKIRKPIYCGLCVAEHYAEQVPEGEEQEMSDALKQELFNYVNKELAAREKNASSKNSGKRRSRSKVSRKHRERKPKSSGEQRRTMTADEATTFEGFSEQNTNLLLMMLDCECSPYLDVFTYGRWQAQGMQVQKGQKSYRIPKYRTIERENEDTGEVKTITIPCGESAVFCRCQVKPVANETAASDAVAVAAD